MLLSTAKPAVSIAPAQEDNGLTAALSAQPVIVAGDQIQTITINYNDVSTTFLTSSFGTNNISVTGPTGQNLVVSYVTVNQSGNGTAEVLYSINAPGGNYVPAGVFNGSGSYVPYTAGTGTEQSFTYSDNGTYAVSINANSVEDSAGNFVQPGSIGTFTVNVPAETASEVQFQQVIVDPNAPGALPVSKTLIDIYNNGDLEGLVGHRQSGGGGLYMYEPENENDPAGPWAKYQIETTGDVYEDLQVADITGSGYEDIVASIGPGDGTYSMYWLENPLTYGGNPTQPWPEFLIGTGLGHNFSLADLLNNGKVDVITQRAIYFQNSPSSWTQIDAPQINMGDYDGEETFDAYNNGITDIMGVSNDLPGHPLVWFENPLNTGGNPETDTWTEHVIGPGYDTAGNSVSFTVGDFTNNGQTQLVTAVSERDNGAPYAPPGGLIIWFPQSDPTQPWTPLTLDSSYTDVHKIDVADINGDGNLDIVVAEQEQSVNQRIAIFYNLDGTGQNWQQQIISNTGEQNIRVGDLTDNGLLDLFGANHGDFGGNDQVEAWLQEGTPVTSVPAPPATLTAYDYQNKQITLDWQNQSALINGYQNPLSFIIQRSTNDQNFSTVATVDQGAFLYSDTSVNSSTTYYYRVAAVNAQGHSAFSPVATIATATIIVPTPIPTATITAPPTVAYGATSFPIEVTYANTVNINPSTVNDSNITVSGPPGTLEATSYSITPPGTGNSITVTYTVAAPAGGFTEDDNGVYNISVNSTQPVADDNGTPVTPGQIGSFQVHLSPPPDVLIGSFASSGHAAGKLLFGTSAGTSVKLTIANGSASVYKNNDGDIDIAMQGINTGAKLTVTTKGGSKTVTFGNITVTGTLLTFTGKTSIISGVLSTTGAIGNLTADQITGTIAAAGTIGTIDASAISGATVISGANLDGGTSLANATFAYGAIGAVKVKGAITDSSIVAGAGFNSNSKFDSTDDPNFGGSIGTITARQADSQSRFVASKIKKASLPKKAVITSDPRFIIL